MAGAAIKGISKILRKGLRKSPVLGKYARGTTTKAGLTARRAALRGETLAEQARGVIPKGVKAPSGFTKTDKEIGKLKSKKEAKAKETKEKLKKSAKEHEKKTKEKREKYGKHHG
jgi:hypothetical protein